MNVPRQVLFTAREAAALIYDDDDRTTGLASRIRLGQADELFAVKVAALAIMADRLQRRVASEIQSGRLDARDIDI